MSQIINNLKHVDVILHMLRLFENEDVVHFDGSVDPLRDMNTVNQEVDYCCYFTCSFFLIEE